MNRKGVLGTGLLYFVYFLMMVLILGGIYGGLIAFFGKGYDARKSESQTMLDKTKECFADSGFFDLDTELNKEAFFDKCGFSSEVLEDGEHFIYVNNSKGKEFFVGVTDFSVRCNLAGRQRNKELPLCSEFRRGNNYILAGSSQSARRIAI